MEKAVLDKKFLEVQKDENGDIFLEFPDDLLETMSWVPGDMIVWSEMANGMGYTVEKAKTFEADDAEVEEALANINNPE